LTNEIKKYKGSVGSVKREKLALGIRHLLLGTPGSWDNTALRDAETSSA